MEEMTREELIEKVVSLEGELREERIYRLSIELLEFAKAKGEEYGLDDFEVVRAFLDLAEEFATAIDKFAEIITGIDPEFNVEEEEN